MDPFQNILWEEISHYPTTVASLALLGIQHCLQFFDIKPSSIEIPYDGYQQKILTANIDEWAILACINEGPLIIIIPNIR